MITERQEVALTGKGDCLEHYHLVDRGPFPIVHGAFYDTTSQTAASTTTAYPVTFDTTLLSAGIEVVSNSQLTVRTDGIFNIQVSLQLRNTDAVDHDVDTWLVVEGTNVVGSNRVVMAPAQHGGLDGRTLVTWNQLQRLGRGEYVQIMWRTINTSVSIAAYATQTTPDRPTTPSAIVTMDMVSI